MNAIDEYIRLAESWGASMEAGDSDTANALYDRVQEKFRSICRTDRQNALFARGDYANDAASFFIASHLKERDKSKAIRIDERLTHSSLPFIGLSAQHALSEIAARGS